MHRTGSLLTVLILLLMQSSSSSENPNRIKYNSEIGVFNKTYQVKPDGMSLSHEKLIPISEEFPGLGVSGVGVSRTITHLHPALGDAANDTLIRGYQNHEGLPDGYIWWNGSEDNGATWELCCAWDLFGATYPSVGYSGSGSKFYGTFVVPSSFQAGGAFVLLGFPNPFSVGTWYGYFAPWNVYGFHDIKMVDLALDNSLEYWNWGYQSAVVSRTSASGNLYDAPLIFYQVSSAPDTWVSWLNMDSCKTASAYIDHVTLTTYSAYDRYDNTDDQFQLVVRQDQFDDWGAPANVLEKNFTDLDQHIRYPVVAANNNSVIIAAATYHDSLPGNYDIVCWVTDDGNLDNLTTMVPIAVTVDEENYPRIEYVENDTFVLTYVKDSILYATRTDDAGLNWTAPEQVSDPSEIVVAEYRCSDIGDGGQKVIYQYHTGRADDIVLNTERLDQVDNDGDGVYFFNDNCPLVSNSSQGDNDGDGLGNDCDNCPNTANIDQADADEDGLGDACDNCFGEPAYDPNDNDMDGIANADDPDDDDDTILDEDDNCPWNANTDQTDSNSDGRGDACDYTCGDVNDDGLINILDIIFLIDAKFKCGPYPRVYESGDSDGNGIFNILDIVWMIDYKFNSGPAPICWP